MQKEEEKKRLLTEEELRKLIEELPDGQFRIVSFGDEEGDGGKDGA